MASLKIRVFPDPQALAEAAAEFIARAAETAIATAGEFTIALSGGQTPRPLYQKLSSEPFINQIDWSKVRIFFADERCVPPVHADSNFRMASETLLDLVPLQPGNIHRLRGEIEPEAAAIEYGQLLKARFGDNGPDVAILGMGEDGHTASLFPDTAALAEQEHRCVANYVEKLNAWRLTMTAPFLNRTKEVLVLVTGQNKAATLHQVLEGERDPKRFPIHLIDPPEGRVIWMLDAAAAEMA
jgi:6-phosphogluconolactonase